uniref:Spindle assembly checkpoint component MAD1-like n=1 Tax=Tanacetum cinerariifolium TaxID=118510 RepID=A0A6L2JK57_TANCI|nr:spindle assembly checkpoint component MAD1-like [Tanacetum cinerariifolium]
MDFRYQKGKVLNEEELEFLPDPGIAEAKEVLMANLSSYGSDVLFEVPYSDNTHNDMLNQSVQEISYSEQTQLVNHLENEITSDSNIIPYSQYLLETQNAAIKDTNSSAQQDAMILFVFEQLSYKVTNCNKVNDDNLIANETLSAELERYKERVKLLEERQNVNLCTREKLIINDIIRDKDAQFADFKKEINSIKQTLFEQLKEKESLIKTFNVFKSESKEKEAKNIDNEIALEKKVKELDNIVHKMGQSAQTVQSKEKEAKNIDNEIALEKKVKELDNIVHKMGQSAQTVHMLRKPQELEFLPDPAVTDTNSFAEQDAMILSVFEQLSYQVTNCKKVNENNLISNETLSAELERYKERVKLLEERQNMDLGTREKLIINDIIRDKDAQFADFENEINSLKQTFCEQIKEKESLIKTFNVFKNESKEKETKNTDNEIDLEKKVKELDKIMHKMGQFAQTVHMLTKPQVFYDNNLKQALGFQNPFYLKKAQQIRSMLYDGSVIAKETNMVSIADSEKTLMLEEESRSKMLLKQRDLIVLEKKVNIKPIKYVELNDYMKTLINVLSHNKNCLMNKLSSYKLHTLILTNLLFRLSKLRLLGNFLREAHEYYLKHTMEQAVILRKVVKQAKSRNPLDSASYSSCIEKLVTITPISKKKTIRFANTVTSSGNIPKVTNRPLLSSIGVNPSTSANRSKPSRNTKNDRIPRTPSSNEKNKVEVQSRKVKSCLNKQNSDSKNVCNKHVKHHVKGVKALCSVCNECLFDANHAMCLIDHVNSINLPTKSASKKNKKRKEWKPTGKVFNSVGYKWKPTGRNFTLAGIVCPLTRITATNKVPLRVPIPLEVVAPKHVVTRVYTKRPKVVQIVLWYLDSGCSKHMTGDRSQLTNFVHKFLGTVKFGNDQVAKMIGNGLVRSLPRLKFVKDHLHSVCAIGKSKKQSHKPKSEDTNQEKLYLLHLDLFGPIRVASVNGKKYILVIVDNYSRFIWVKFLTSKDEAPDFIINNLKPALHEMTPATPSSGLVPNLPPLASFVPPSRYEWDLVFQPMFDEFFSPPASVSYLILVEEALAPVELTGSPSSTTVDQDAPSPSTSQTIPQSQSQTIPLCAEEKSHDLEVAHISNHPYFGNLILETVSNESSSSDVIPTTVHSDAQISEPLRLQISQSPRGIFLNQSKYALESLKKYVMEYCDIVDTPMARPTKKNLHAIKRIFRYLKGTVNQGLWHSKDSAITLTAFADADHAGCQDTRRSTSRTALDNALVPPEKRLKIERCYAIIAFSKPQREETYQVTLDALNLSAFYPAFQYRALIPKDMINQDIKYSEAYKTYYVFATGEVPSRKARKYKKVASPSRKLSPVKEAELLEIQKVSITTNIS